MGKVCQTPILSTLILTRCIPGERRSESEQNARAKLRKGKLYRPKSDKHRGKTFRVERRLFQEHTHALPVLVAPSLHSYCRQMFGTQHMCGSLFVLCFSRLVQCFLK